jgi:general secretion pathway protein A
MYKQFFGLRENPFNVNPDPRFLFLTPQTREALDELTFGIQARRGLTLLTGEVGTGKTTLLNRLLDWLRGQQTPTAFIFNSHLETSHLFDFILADFGVPFDARLKDNALLRLNQWLFERYRAGETPVLIVDEAQGLADHVLEEIRMLLNLETPSEKLLQIVLSGQPELEIRLKRPELRQVKQRITLRCKTAALTPEQTNDYIRARLRIAGANGTPVFASEAIEAVYLYSGGIPRVINLLCEHALINAYVEHVRPVPAPIVAEVAREFQFDDIKPVAPFVGSSDAPDLNLIAAQSRFAIRPIPPSATAELPGKECSSALTTRVSAPHVVADTVAAPVEEAAAPLLDCEHVPNVEEDVRTHEALADQDMAQPVSWPRQVEANKPSDLTELFSELVSEFSSGSEMQPAPLALPPLLNVSEAKGKFELLPAPNRRYKPDPQAPPYRPTTVEALLLGALRSNLTKIIALRLFLTRWSARSRDHFSSTAASLARTQWAATLHYGLMRLLQLPRAWFWPHQVWSDRFLATVKSIDWRRRKASVYRWLQQPWDPTRWRFPDLRLFEARRRFSYKKM